MNTLDLCGAEDNIDVQLRKHGFKVADPLERVRYQKLADNITELYQAGILSVNATNKARKNLVKIVLDNVVEIDSTKGLSPCL